MRGEDILLYISSVLVALMILLAIKRNKWFAWINLLVFVIYSTYMYYGLFFRSQGNGTALAWWFYLLIFTLMQLIFIVGYRLIGWFKKKKSKV